MIGWLCWMALAAMGLGTAASPAWALDTGQCLPAAQVRAALAAEGQSPIITGNRSGYGYPTALIFTSNADGSKGYAVRGDKPLGQQAETICIDSVYRDVRLNDITRSGVPAWAMMSNADAEAADAICARGGLGYQDHCNFYNQGLANLDSNGTHIMLMATGTAINPRDKSVRADQRLIVAVSPADNKGIVKATTKEGASYMLSAYTTAGYTQAGNAMIR